MDTYQTKQWDKPSRTEILPVPMGVYGQSFPPISYEIDPLTGVSTTRWGFNREYTVSAVHPGFFSRECRGSLFYMVAKEGGAYLGDFATREEGLRFVLSRMLLVDRYNDNRRPL